MRRLVILAAAALSMPDMAAGAPVLAHRVTAVHPHDPAHFTQGLVWAQGRLFESVGGYGSSALLEKDLATGRTLRRQNLPPHWFGEGLAFTGGRLIQLTWREGLGLIWSLALEPLARFDYAGEGWGLTAARIGGRELLVRSNGSARLDLLDATSMKVLGHLGVRDGQTAVLNLNELEFAQGRIWANVWHTQRVLAIDPLTGQVTAELDLSALSSGMEKPPGWRPDEHVLNGLAWDAQRARLLVTGKCWPRLFEIEISPES